MIPAHAAANSTVPASNAQCHQQQTLEPLSTHYPEEDIAYNEVLLEMNVRAQSTLLENPCIWFFVDLKFYCSLILTFSLCWIDIINRTNGSTSVDNVSNDDEALFTVDLNHGAAAVECSRSSSSTKTPGSKHRPRRYSPIHNRSFANMESIAMHYAITCCSNTSVESAVDSKPTSTSEEISSPKRLVKSASFITSPPKRRKVDRQLFGLGIGLDLEQLDSKKNSTASRTSLRDVYKRGLQQPSTPITTIKASPSQNSLQSTPTPAVRKSTSMAYLRTLSENDQNRLPASPSSTTVKTPSCSIQSPLTFTPVRRTSSLAQLKVLSDNDQNRNTPPPRIRRVSSRLQLACGDPDSHIQTIRRIPSQIKDDTSSTDSPTQLSKTRSRLQVVGLQDHSTTIETPPSGLRRMSSLLTIHDDDLSGSNIVTPEFTGIRRISSRFQLKVHDDLLSTPSDTPIQPKLRRQSLRLQDENSSSCVETPKSVLCRLSSNLQLQDTESPKSSGIRRIQSRLHMGLQSESSSNSPDISTPKIQRRSSFQDFSSTVTPTQHKIRRQSSRFQLPDDNLSSIIGSPDTDTDKHQPLPAIQVKKQRPQIRKYTSMTNLTSMSPLSTAPTASTPTPPTTSTSIFSTPVAIRKSQIPRSTSISNIRQHPQEHSPRPFTRSMSSPASMTSPSKNKQTGMVKSKLSIRRRISSLS